MSGKETLSDAWVKVTEAKLGRSLTPEEVDQFDGQDGKLDWNEAKALHDNLISKEPLNGNQINDVLKEVYGHEIGDKFYIGDQEVYLAQIDGEASVMQDGRALDLGEVKEMIVEGHSPSIADDGDLGSEDDITNSFNNNDVETEISDSNTSSSDGSSEVMDQENEVKKISGSENNIESSNKGFFRQFLNDQNSSATNQLYTAEKGGVIKLGEPIEMRSDNGSLIRVDKFKFTGREDARGRYYEYFQVGKKDPSEQVILKIEASDNRGVENITIKGYEELENLDGSEDVFDQVSYGSEITNVDYYDPIKRVVSPGINNLDKNIVLSVNDKDIEINQLKLLNVKGEVKDGEIMKHFIAQGTNGKKYDLFTKEDWKVLYKGEDTAGWDQAYINTANQKGCAGYQEGTIDYDIEEIESDDLNLENSEEVGGSSEAKDFNYLKDANDAQIRSFILKNREGGVYASANHKYSDLDLESDLEKIYDSNLTDQEKHGIFTKFNKVLNEYLKNNPKKDDLYRSILSDVDNNLDDLEDRIDLDIFHEGYKGGEKKEALNHLNSIFKRHQGGDFKVDDKMAIQIRGHLFSKNDQGKLFYHGQGDPDEVFFKTVENKGPGSDGRWNTEDDIKFTHYSARRNTKLN